MALASLSMSASGMFQPRSRQCHDNRCSAAERSAPPRLAALMSRLIVLRRSVCRLLHSTARSSCHSNVLPESISNKNSARERSGYGARRDPHGVFRSKKALPSKMIAQTSRMYPAEALLKTDSRCGLSRPPIIKAAPANHSSKPAAQANELLNAVPGSARIRTPTAAAASAMTITTVERDAKGPNDHELALKNTCSSTPELSNSQGTIVNTADAPTVAAKTSGGRRENRAGIRHARASTANPNALLICTAARLS